MNEAQARRPAVNPGGREVPLLSRWTFHPVLFAAWPVLLLYADNVVDVGIDELIFPLLVVVGATTFITVALSRLSRDPRSAAVVLSAIVIVLLLFGMVRDSVVPDNIIDVMRANLLALAASIAVLSLAVWLASLSRHIGQLTLALNVVSSTLVVLALSPLGLFAADSQLGVASVEARPPIRMGANLDSTTPKRDIYHIVFDRYGSEDALRAGHHIDNSAFIAWLKARGFDVVDRSHANYQKTLLSLASTLSVEPLDELARRMGRNNRSEAPLASRIRNNRAASLLQDIGYRYIHIGSWYGKTRASAIADTVRNPSAQASFLDALLSRSILSVAWTNVGDGTRLVREATEYQFGELADIESEAGPTYVFAHVLLPHPPFVYMADGTLAPSQATFESQLRFTNSRIREVVDRLLAVPEPDRPIIILQADEGPYPERYSEDQANFDWSTATDEELLMKFGILNAMFLPGPGGSTPLRDDLTPVNTYVELLRRYFGATIDDLPDRSYSLRGDRPYDLVDVTDRLDEAQAHLDADRRVATAEG